MVVCERKRSRLGILHFCFIRKKFILIENKNMFGAEEIISEKSIPEGLKQLILQLPELFGTLDKLLFVKKEITNKRALAAIDRLERLYALLEEYGLGQYITFDLGMLSKFNYYTGIIFRAYTSGTGDAIATGGRYDSLVGQFGKDAPAIGFMIVVDDLLAAMNRQGAVISGVEKCAKLYYTQENFREMLREARQMRAAGKCVELLPKK